jgi:hypothetical protein
VNIFGLRKNPRFTTEDTDDPMDGGGRAMHGAIAENTEILIG